MTNIHSLTAEWLPVSIRPSDDEDLEIRVMDYDGIVVALSYPCHKSGAGWVDASKTPCHPEYAISGIRI